MGPGPVQDPASARSSHQPQQHGLFEELPDGLLQQHVLPRLGPQERKALRGCSSRWRHLVNRSVTVAHVTAADLEQPTPCDSCRAHAAAARPSPPPPQLGARFPQLKSLSVSDAGHATWSEGDLWAFLQQGLPQLRQLSHLDFKRCHHVSEGLLDRLRRGCPALEALRPSRWTDAAALAQLARFDQLKELDLGDADVDVITVDDVGLAVLVAGGLPGLVTLSLERCRWLSDAAFKSLGRLRGLRRVNLRHTDVGRGGLEGLAALAGLEELQLSNCRLVDDAAIAALAASSSLARLVLADTPVSNSGLRHCASVEALAHLDLGPRFEVDDEGLGHLGRCGALRTLIVGSFNLTSSWQGGGGGGVLRGSGGAAAAPLLLEHLSFGGAFANKGLHHLFPVPTLTSLHVQGIHSVTDAVMHTLARQTSLTRLSLQSGYSLTEQGLSVLQQLPRLQRLDIRACPAISNSAVGGFVAAHVQMEALLAARGGGGCGAQGGGAPAGGLRRCYSCSY